MTKDCAIILRLKKDGGLLGAYDTSQNNESPNTQNNGNTNPNNDKTTNSKTNDKPSIGLSILSFFIPLVGIILAAVNWKSKPISAKRYLIISVVSIIFCIFLNIVGASGGSDKHSSVLDKHSSIEVNENEKPVKDIFEAAENCDIEAIKAKLAIGADVNVKNKYGETPLYIAANKCNNEIIKTLIASGADVNAADKYGNTPLTSAMRWHFFDPDPDIEVIKTLIAAGADVNASKAIVYSCVKDKSVVTILIDAGADVNQQDHNNSGVTALHIAANSLSAINNTDCIKLLIDSGANINVKSEDGGTPLHWAAGDGRIANVKLLVSLGANTQANNQEGLSPLDLAKKRLYNSSNTSDEYKNNLKLTIDYLEKITRY